MSVQVNIRGERYGVAPPLCRAGSSNGSDGSGRPSRTLENGGCKLTIHLHFAKTKGYEAPEKRGNILGCPAKIADY